MNRPIPVAENTPELLAPAQFIDSDHPEIVAFSEAICGSAQRPITKAVALYYAVRDQIRYNPHIPSLEPEAMVASRTLSAGEGFCIPKALLLAAVARAAGIPSRVGFADVRNHLTSEKLLQRMGSDLFVFHGYTELWLEDRWVKATPAFNLALCERFGVEPLEFDGRQDSLFHPFDSSGRKHMEYVREHGSFSDLPYQEFVTQFNAAYPHFFDPTDSPTDQFENSTT
ncbi:MAG: transglutaminase family protein [Gammaproteobacteria bacterium]|nr:transglutaminase family protein [Gammaproteobacteria bacterium]